MVIALLMVGTSIVPTSPRDQAQAADPLAEAKAQQDALEATLSAQRAALAALKAKATTLAGKLSAAKAQLASVTEEFNRVSGLLSEVQVQVAEITARLAELRAQIAALDEQLRVVAVQIRVQTEELRTRESLLEDHIRALRAQDIVLSCSSPPIRSTQHERSRLQSPCGPGQAAGRGDQGCGNWRPGQTLRDGRREIAAARDEADAQAALLAQREAELAAMQKELARLQAAAEQKQREQEAALNAALEAGDVAADCRQPEGRRPDQAVASSGGGRAAPGAISVGFKWPMVSFRVTQEWGPTNFRLEPSYTYKGVYYPHFHGGIDLANGCGTPILAIGTGTVKASGQPLWPWDSGSGVVIRHGSGVQSWYWHLKAQVVVRAGQVVSRGQVIGYEGNTGNSTGCHLHMGINDHGVWENPRVYLP
jgi:murein DD-endopeptidase MepM/ murein hydrolase activator NlpD